MNGATAANGSTTVVQTLNNIQPESFTDEHSRKEALTAARALITRLETPWETMWHMSHEVPAFNAALRVAIDHGVFEKLDRDPSTPKSPEDLSAGADPALLNRFLRHLAALNIIKSAGPNLYLPTRHSSSLTNPVIYSPIDYYRDISSPAFISLPEFLSATNYVTPTTTAHGNWQYMLGREESHFEWLFKNPAINKNFGNLMAGYTSQRGSWLDIFPPQALLEGAKADGPLIVDVGGGFGQDITKFLNNVPESAGRLVVQDLPQIAEEAQKSVLPGITAQGQDFFEPQKVHGLLHPQCHQFHKFDQTDVKIGARAYFLHSVFHDWPDDKCKLILANLKPALQPGYSRLLINEMVIPTAVPTAYQTTLDMTMLALFSSKERTEEDWISLLTESGFKIVKIWSGPAAAEAVIEAELA